MDKGLGDKYKGKSLNDIDINPEVDLAESDDSENDSPITERNLQSTFEPIISQPSTSASVSIGKLNSLNCYSIIINLPFYSPQKNR